MSALDDEDLAAPLSHDECVRRARALADTPVELRRLRRVRDAAIAHLAMGDVRGAMVALCLQRDDPEMFDRTLWESDPNEHLDR